MTSLPLAYTRALVRAIRPRQWTKNFAVFFGIVFAQRLLNPLLCERALLACVIFCFTSSSMYLFNDLRDLEKDRQHPVKCLRPIASGQLPVSWAITAMIMLLLLCVALTASLFLLPLTPQQDIFAAYGGANLLFALVIIAYVTLMVFYNLSLKHIVLIDVFTIALGFILRILAGTTVVAVSISAWLYLVTCFLSLFLALAKRRHELVLLQGDASLHRQILKEYSIPMLDQMITIVATGALVSYSIYTVESSTGNRRLIITVPFVLFGMFRYLYLVYMRKEGGSPEEVLLRDRYMFVTVILCTAAILAVLYVFTK